MNKSSNVVGLYYFYADLYTFQQTIFGGPVHLIYNGHWLSDCMMIELDEVDQVFREFLFRQQGDFKLRVHISTNGISVHRRKFDICQQETRSSSHFRLPISL